MTTEENLDSSSKKWIILFSIVIVIFMTCVDASIVNVALPVIAHDLKVSIQGVQWTITTYLIVIAGLILTFGRLGDIIGKVRVFKVGIIIFTIGSLLCAFSNNLTYLIVARAIQGLGAACIMANSKGIITATFSIKERGKALGITALVVALGGMMGPAIGGIISEFKWQYIFLINIPIGIFATILAFKVLPLSKKISKDREKLDIIGTILFLITIVSLVGAITEGSIYGYSNKYIVILFFIVIIIFSLFIITQIKRKSPILDLKIFKNSRFSKGIIVLFLIFIATSTYTILIPFYYEYVRQISPGMSGLLMMVYPIALSISSPIAGTLSDKMGRELLPFIGLLICGVGFVLLGTLTINTSLAIIIVYMLITGIGNGLCQAPMNIIILSAVEKKQLGIAGSISGLVRNLGMILGVVFGIAILYELMSMKLGYRVKGFVEGQVNLFSSSMDIVFFIAAFICFVGAIIVFSMIVRGKIKVINHKEIESN